MPRNGRKRHLSESGYILKYRFSKNVTPEKLENLKEKIDNFLVNEAIPEQDFIGQERCGGAVSVAGPFSGVSVNCDCVGGT